MQTIKLDLSCYEAAQSILAKQGDVGRKFMAVITDNGADYEIKEDMTVSLWYASTSGAGNYTTIGERSAFSIAGNTITVEMIAQMVANKGGGTMCLMLHGADGTQIATWNIAYIVEHVPGFDSEGATQYYTALSEAAATAVNCAKVAQDAANEAREILDDTVRSGMYSGEINVHNAVGNRTKTFWDQVIDIYDSMELGTVKFVLGKIHSDYSESDPNEPVSGFYRVVITKSMDEEKGFVEVTSYEADASTFKAPYVMTRVKIGAWKDAESPLRNIYNSIRKELLWENSSSGSPIQTTISLPFRVIYYNALLIQVNMDTSRQYSASVLIRSNNAKNIGAAYFPAGNYNDDSWGSSLRYFFWSDDKRSLSMSEGLYEGLRSNSRAIPFRVYGLIL